MLCACVYMPLHIRSQCCMSSSIVFLAHQKLMLHVFLNCLPPYFLRLNMEFTNWQDWISSDPKDMPIFTSPVLWYRYKLM